MLAKVGQESGPRWPDYSSKSHVYFYYGAWCNIKTYPPLSRVGLQPTLCRYIVHPLQISRTHNFKIAI